MLYPQNNFVPMNNQVGSVQPLVRQQNNYANQNTINGINGGYMMQSQYSPQFFQQTNLFAKIVDSVDAVKATDVPMDGNIYYFPKADGTEIFGKQWLMNGQTQILTFRPVSEQELDSNSQSIEKAKFDLSDETIDTFMKRFDEIERRLDDFVSKNTTKVSTRAKKEDET